MALHQNAIYAQSKRLNMKVRYQLNIALLYIHRQNTNDSNSIFIHVYKYSRVPLQNIFMHESFWYQSSSYHLRHEKILYIGDIGIFVYLIFQQFVETYRGVIFNIKTASTELFRLGKFYFCLYFLFLAPSLISNPNKNLCILNEISQD